MGWNNDYINQGRQIVYAAEAAANAAMDARSAYKSVKARWGAGKTYSAKKTGKVFGNDTKENQVVRSNHAVKRHRKKKISLTDLAKRVKEVECASGIGCKIYRFRGTSRCVNSSTMGIRATYNTSNFSRSHIEGMIDDLKVFDPAAPATLKVVDFNQAGFSHQICFHKRYVKAMVRNNYQVPCIVDLGLWICKRDQDANPITLWSNGLADLTSTTIASPLVHPSDSATLLADFHCVKHSRTRLVNGEELVMEQGLQDFDYDPALVVDHGSAAYLKGITHFWVVMVEGVLGHDTVVSTEQPFGLGGVDFADFITCQVKYDAGIDLKYIVVEDSSDATVTTAFVTGSKPVADNQGFSTA